MSRLASRIIGLLALGAVVASVGSPTSLIAEPEVTCSWCVPTQDYLGNPANEHRFPNPSNPCLQPAPGEVTYFCSRCGGTSSCHSSPQEGPCHLACGGEGLARAEEALRTLVREADATKLLVALSRTWEGLEVRYVPAGGRIELVADCNRAAVATRIVVPHELRKHLTNFQSGTFS